MLMLISIRRCARSQRRRWMSRYWIVWGVRVSPPSQYRQGVWCENDMVDSKTMLNDVSAFEGTKLSRRGGMLSVTHPVLGYRKNSRRKTGNWNAASKRYCERLPYTVRYCDLYRNALLTCERPIFFHDNQMKLGMRFFSCEYCFEWIGVSISRPEKNCQRENGY